MTSKSLSSVGLCLSLLALINSFVTWSLLEFGSLSSQLPMVLNVLLVICVTIIGQLGAWSGLLEGVFSASTLLSKKGVSKSACLEVVMGFSCFLYTFGRILIDA
jgi:hypothetical protein